MAISFNGSSDKITAAIASQSQPVTLACRFLPDNITTSNVLVKITDGSSDFRYLQFAGHVAGDPMYYTHNDSAVSADTVAVGASGISAGTWNAVAGITSSNTVRARRLNGTSVSGSGASVAPTGMNSVRVGHYSSNNYHDGLIACAAVWNVALTDAECDSLRAGFPPRRVRPQSLIFCVDGVRNLIDLKGAALTVTGTTVGDHPRSYGY